MTNTASLAHPTPADSNTPARCGCPSSAPTITRRGSIFPTSVSSRKLIRPAAPIFTPRWVAIPSTLVIRPDWTSWKTMRRAILTARAAALVVASPDHAVGIAALAWAVPVALVAAAIRAHLPPQATRAGATVRAVAEEFFAAEFLVERLLQDVLNASVQLAIWLGCRSIITKAIITMDLGSLSPTLLRGSALSATRVLGRARTAVMEWSRMCVVQSWHRTTLRYAIRHRVIPFLANHSSNMSRLFSN